MEFDMTNAIMESIKMTWPNEIGKYAKQWTVGEFDESAIQIDSGAKNKYGMYVYRTHCRANKFFS